MKPHTHTVVFTLDGQDHTERVPCSGFLCGSTRENRVDVSFVSAPIRKAKAS